MDILSNKSGHKELMLGNEAIVRGALEAGVGFASTYPGTPSSEIGNTFFKIAKKAGMYFEFSANEKVATEVSAAAAASGVRSLAFMKHVGLNVAADAFMTLIYVGVKAGMVIVSADDPSCHSSQNEQDNRYYALFGHCPMLEPSTAQEAKDMTKIGYELSEKLELPVLLRTTTRINHMKGVVEFSDLKEIKNKGHFEKDANRWVTVPAIARKRRLVLLENMKKAEEISENSPFNYMAGEEGDIGIITSGISFNYVMDVIRELGVKASVLKLGMTNPLPRMKIADFISSKKKVITVEELEPYLEKEVNVIANMEKIDTAIHGKMDGHFPYEYEYNVDIVKRGIGSILGIDVPEPKKPMEVELPHRPPVLCPGCGHRATYYAAKKGLRGKDVVFSSDIGCYTLGIQPPLETADFLLCMGSSVGAAGGFSKATDQTIVSFIGDSTFFHAGIAGLVNGVYNGHKFIYVILDNRTTAMTGHQPHPGVGVTGMGETAPHISIENIVKGIGVEWVRTVHAYDMDEMVKAFKEASEHDGVSVIVAKDPCILTKEGAKETKGPKVATIDQEKCVKCHICIRTFACPAFYTEEERTVKINDLLCTGCMACLEVCPHDAIKEGE